MITSWTSLPLLPLVWGAILSLVIIMYVLLDGFDLGIGILFPWIKSAEERDIMITTIAPIWDGNQTWLVLGGAFLYAAFPRAYATLLPLLYLPITIMLAALIFRGVAFEFRFKAVRSRYLWDWAFAAGSIVAAFCQGLMLGTFVIGYISLDQSISNPFHWFSWFSVMTGVALTTGYALLGATWLILKTTGELQQHMYRFAPRLLVGVGFFMALVSLWTPLEEPYIWKHWFTYPNFLYLSLLPFLTAWVFIVNGYALHHRYEKSPFYLTILLFILGYIGFCISDWPYIVPHRMTLWEASAPFSSQAFLLVGAAILLPVLIAYTVNAYRIFSGKVVNVEHYH